MYHIILGIISLFQLKTNLIKRNFRIFVVVNPLTTYHAQKNKKDVSISGRLIRHRPGHLVTFCNYQFITFYTVIALYVNFCPTLCISFLSLSSFLDNITTALHVLMQISPLSIRNYNEEPRLSTSNENRYFRGTSDEIPNLWLIASKRCLASISSFDFGDVRRVFLEDRGLDPGICSCNIKWDCPCLRYATKR